MNASVSAGSASLSIASPPAPEVTAAWSRWRPAGPTVADQRAPTARWPRLALLVLLALTAAAYLWGLSASGTANSFYTAAVQAGTKSWKAFFFGSLDSSNFITVDKPPGSLWVMELSARLFGFNTWSVLVPQALEGVAAVGLLYATVRRWFGVPAGLLAGAILACTPVAALMFRFNNPDALLVLLLVAGAYALVRAVERGGTRWIVLAGTMLGLAFLAKMLQAFTVVPAFAGVYLLAAPGPLRRRLWHLVLGGIAVVVAAGWWVAIVALWPAGSRPMIDGSSDNSILNLIFGYNGLNRLSSSGGGPGGSFSGPTGLFRLFNDLMGGQASWLLPAALLVVAAGLLWRRRAPRTDRFRAALLLWGGWLVVTGAVFSFGQGVIHTYYTVALAPAIGALLAIGTVLVWQGRDRLAVRLGAAAAIAGTAVWAFVLLDRTPGYQPWARLVILAAGFTSAAVVVLAPAGKRLARPITMTALGAGLAACLLGPITYTVTTIATPHAGSVVSAGPALAASGGGAGGGFAGAATGGGFAGGAAAQRGRVAGQSAGTAVAPPSGGRGTAPSGLAPATGSAGGTSGASPPGGTSGAAPSGGTARGGATGALPGGTAGRVAGGAMGSDTALVRALKSGAHRYRWAAATFGSQSAASLELASGEAVMAIGGFSGQGGNISLATFESYVAKGEIHYFIASGGGTPGGGGAPGGGAAPSGGGAVSGSRGSTGRAAPGGGASAGGPGGAGNADQAITTWVESHFATKTIGGQTVYDLSQRTR